MDTTVKDLVKLEENRFHSLLFFKSFVALESFFNIID